MMSHLLLIKSALNACAGYQQHPQLYYPKYHSKQPDHQSKVVYLDIDQLN
ncbi:hypothetical protein LX87_05516 [Larkinella arboricola]|uniref:Uncharacterized protein n=1 Tax=Larkinella arboricola TaxID=643671 RepID=A0A327WGJ8_LARAB|nr:hypothetical protein LX87_05516 [Larkinella arboricola]